MECLNEELARLDQSNFPKVGMIDLICPRISADKFISTSLLEMHKTQSPPRP